MSFWIIAGNHHAESQESDCTNFIFPYCLATSYGVRSTSTILNLPNATSSRGFKTELHGTILGDHINVLWARKYLR